MIQNRGMQVVFRVLFVGFLIFGFIGSVSSQEATAIRKVKTDEGEFIIHEVEKGQTLYAISKTYSVSVEEIIIANPELNNFGIRIGQTIRIPVKEINKRLAKKAEITLSGDTIYHEVLKKETLYGLSKRYQISPEEIERYNPILKDGLKIGMVVKIPAIPVSEVAEVADTDIEFQKPQVDSLTLHEVTPKETLYSLSKDYHVSPDSIQMVNDGLSEGLQVGTTIRIPVLNPDVEIWDTIVWDAADTNFSNQIYAGDTLIVAVFLPFSIDRNKEIQEQNKNENIYTLTTISIEFMRGFDLAMDSLKQLGYHTEVNYFDNKNDTAECRRLMEETNFEEYHLFVGPLFQVNFKIISEKAKELKIPIVSPVKISSRLLLNNPYVVKGFSSSPAQVIYLTKYLAKQFKDSNMVLFSGGAPKDLRYATIFQKYYNNEVNDSIAINRIWTPSVGNYEKYIKKGVHNYIALISNDEAFVSSSLTVFYGMIDEETQITVFGVDSWNKFGSIDYEYLMAMNVTYPVQQHIEYSSKSIQNFLSVYREKYLIDPSKLVFSGFDIGLYFGNAMFKAKGNWKDYFVENAYKGYSLSFDFVKISKESGFENQGGYMLRYDDYELNLVR